MNDQKSSSQNPTAMHVGQFTATKLLVFVAITILATTKFRHAQLRTA